MTAGLRSTVLALSLILTSGCAPAPVTSAPVTFAPVTSAPAVPPSISSPLVLAIREWEARTGDLFKRSARALQQISSATDDGDEASVRSGCQRLHDINTVELQRLLPTPDPALTAELQRMIDDMNIATHACVRFVIARQPGDSSIYQDYLARAVDHLQQAKVILDADLRTG